MGWLRGLVRLIAALGVLALIGSYGGALHPAGDSLAIFRLWIAGAVLTAALLLLVLTDRWGALYFGALAAVTAFTPAQALLNAAPAGEAVEPSGLPYSLYQKNLLFLSREPDAILAEIEARRPDFLTLQEVSDANRAAIYDRLPEEYDRAICPFAGVGDVAIATRYSMIDGTTLCIERLGLVAAQVNTRDGVVWLVSVHLHWPWPFGQSAQVAQILPLLERMRSDPILIGGDFNTVRWAHVMQEFRRASATRIVEQGAPTFRLSWEGRNGPGFEIDHVLLPGRGPSAVELLDYHGSDHRGLLVWFAL